MSANSGAASAAISPPKGGGALHGVAQPARQADERLEGQRGQLRHYDPPAEIDQHATLRRSPYCDVTATRKKWYGEGNGMQYEAESVVASKLGDNVSQFVLLKFVTP